ncbi:MAG: rhodanese-like domain-containing protein [Myxococcota bacterium]
MSHPAWPSLSILRPAWSAPLLSLSLLACAPSTPPAPASGATLSSPGENTTTSSTAPASLSSIDITALQQKLKEQPNLNLIDVRTPEEFASGHVQGARNIPLDQLEARLEEVGAAPLYLICRSGNRSRQAGQLLVARGRSAINVEGGTSAWISAGNPVQ